MSAPSVGENAPSPPALAPAPALAAPPPPAPAAPCLVVRPNKPGAVFSSRPVLSVRLEGDGHAAYFPLDTPDPPQAAAHARRLRRELGRDGWAAIAERYPRELTLAVFWCASPACCTYTTLYTLAPQPAASPAATEDRLRVAIVEPERAVPKRWPPRSTPTRTSFAWRA